MGKWWISSWSRNLRMLALKQHQICDRRALNISLYGDTQQPPTAGSAKEFRRLLAFSRKILFFELLVNFLLLYCGSYCKLIYYVGES